MKMTQTQGKCFFCKKEFEAGELIVDLKSLGCMNEDTVHVCGLDILVEHKCLCQNCFDTLESLSDAHVAKNPAAA